MDKAEFMLTAFKLIGGRVEFRVRECAVLHGDKVSFNNSDLEPVHVTFPEGSPFVADKFTLPPEGELVLPVREDAELGAYPFRANQDGKIHRAEVRISDVDNEGSISFVFSDLKLLAGCNVFSGAAAVFRVDPTSDVDVISVRFQEEGVLLRPDGTAVEGPFDVRKGAPKTLYVDDFLEMESFIFDVGPSIEQVQQQSADDSPFMDEVEPPPDINPDGAEQGDLLIIPR